MTNRKEKIEIETVHNHVHHAGIKKQFEFLQKINRTLLILLINGVMICFSPYGGKQ